MKKYLIVLSIVLSLSMEVLAEEGSDCVKLGSFFPYKAGIYAEQKSFQKINAFDIFCNLSYKGDYRAQFKLAKYYEKGVPDYVDANLTYALIWAKLSNSQIKSRKRQIYIDRLIKTLDEKEINTANKLYDVVKLYMPSGLRIDMEYKEIDLEEVFRNQKKEYTGSRIKRKKPFNNISIIQ
jgi:hypothetical protein